MTFSRRIQDNKRRKIYELTGLKELPKVKISLKDAHRRAFLI
jgi:hypothetical protein